MREVFQFLPISFRHHCLYLARLFPHHVGDEEGERMTVIDLRNVRLEALQRVQSAIKENEERLASMSLGHPQRYLIRSLLKMLRRNEAALAAGIVPRHDRVG